MRIKAKTPYTISSVRFGILKDEFFLNVNDESDIEEIKSLVKDKFIEILDDNVSENKKPKKTKDIQKKDPIAVTDESGSRVTMATVDGIVESKMTHNAISDDIEDLPKTAKSEVKPEIKPEVKPEDKTDKKQKKDKKEKIEEKIEDEEIIEKETPTVVTIASGRGKTKQVSMQNSVVNEKPSDSPFIEDPKANDTKEDNDEKDEGNDIFIDI